jgi:Protein  of unknown function (DUF3018)
MGKHEPILDKTKDDRERAARRAQGLCPRVFWLPDTSDPAWRAEMRRQSLAIANSPTAAEDQAFVDSISIWDELPTYGVN